MELSKGGLARRVWMLRSAGLTRRAVAAKCGTNTDAVSAILDGGRYEEYWSPTRAMRAQVAALNRASSPSDKFEIKITSIFEQVCNGAELDDIAQSLDTSTAYIKRVVRRSNGGGVPVPDEVVYKANMAVFGEMRVVGSAVV